MSRINRPPLSLSRLSTLMKGKEDKIGVVVGSVTDDIRVHDIPAMKITALRFTERVRAIIEKAGGECLTFDQLALRAPLGQNTIEASLVLLFYSKNLEFWQCMDCNQLYWEGTQYHNAVQKFIDVCKLNEQPEGDLVRQNT